MQQLLTARGSRNIESNNYILQTTATPTFATVLFSHIETHIIYRTANNVTRRHPSRARACQRPTTTGPTTTTTTATRTDRLHVSHHDDDELDDDDDDDDDASDDDDDDDADDDDDDDDRLHRLAADSIASTAALSCACAARWSAI